MFLCPLPLEQPMLYFRNTLVLRVGERPRGEIYTLGTVAGNARKTEKKKRKKKIKEKTHKTTKPEQTRRFERQENNTPPAGHQEAFSARTQTRCAPSPRRFKTRALRSDWPPPERGGTLTLASRGGGAPPVRLLPSVLQREGRGVTDSGCTSVFLLYLIISKS